MSKQRIYTGSSGQMAVMAELLFRQCNAAVPVVDLGTDVFAFQDDRELIARIQVKTGQGERYKREEGYSVPFQLPMAQLRHLDSPALYYVLAVRLEGRYVDFLVFRRSELKDYWNGGLRFGTEDRASGNLVLTIQFRPGQVVCGEVDLTGHRDAWNVLPPLQPQSEAKPTPATANPLRPQA
jgi:hypothetical protein